VADLERQSPAVVAGRPNQESDGNQVRELHEGDSGTLTPDDEHTVAAKPPASPATTDLSAPGQRRPRLPSLHHRRPTGEMP